MSMKLLILAGACLAVVSCASLPVDELEQEFQEWKVKFGKVYKTPEEEAWRKDIWLATRVRVLAHNAEADQGKHTWWMGMNQFADKAASESSGGCSFHHLTTSTQGIQ